MRLCGFLFSVFLFASTLSFAQTPKTPDSIEKMFSDELNSVRGISKEPQGEREHRALVDALIDRLEVGDENQRYEATVLLEKEVRPSDIPLIVDALGRYDNSPEAHLPLIKALGATKAQAALEPLRDQFNRGNVDTQVAVIDALAKIPDERIVNMLADILASGDIVPVHVRAASALGKIGGDKALYALNAVTENLKPGAERSAVLWAIRYANGEIPEKRIDTELDEGRQQNYYYKGMIYYLYRPAFRVDAPKASWLLVCIHGSELNFEQTIDLCQPIAKQFKTSLLVPFFDPINFPEYKTFNLQGVRSDKRFLEILDHISAKAEIRTREIYMLGLGDGGDFSQRFTYFYPDRIARAAFNSTFFYPLDTSQYFPLGLKTTPLASDLKFDIFKVIKTDFMYILDPYQGGQRGFKQFNTALEGYTSKSQHPHRIRGKELSEKENSIEGSIKVGREFLFPPL